MTNKTHISALIVAAGSGVRAGGEVPKQYRRVAGRPLLRYSAGALLDHPRISHVQVVISPEHRVFYEEAVQGLQLPAPVIGGEVRSTSVRAGLKALAEAKPDYVMVHDAARPFLSAGMIDALIAKLDADTGVLPALAVADTVRRRTDEGGWKLIKRAGLKRMQTPQAFPFAKLLQLHETYAGNATDDAALWLDAGLKLEYVEGEERLRKVTTAEDMAWAEAAAQGAMRTAVGMGTDVHALMPAGQSHKMRLGGIDIAHDHKLHGHSDADVVLHAVVDAMLGALGEDDIGAHFPPSDPNLKGADSKIFIEEAVKIAQARGAIIEHIDVTIICEAPKIAPHREEMRQALAGLLDIPRARVSIKATTTEKLGFTGRGEGIAAQAVATLKLPHGDNA